MPQALDVDSLGTYLATAPASRLSTLIGHSRRDIWSAAGVEIGRRLQLRDTSAVDREKLVAVNRQYVARIDHEVLLHRTERERLEKLAAALRAKQTPAGLNVPALASDG
jgi:hypothetical protein